MSEEHDNRISDLYRQSSQETPPAHIDRAVMERARKSVRSRVYSPFGNHWVAGGAVVGVIMLSVLLIQIVPSQLDIYGPGDDVMAPSNDVPSARQKESTQEKALMSEMPARVDEKREAPEAPKPRFDFHTILPDMDVVVPEEDARARTQQAPVAKESASAPSTLPAEIYYLQAGSFREQTRADALKTKLLGLGFKCEIQKASLDKTNTFYRVRVGPYIDLDTLAQAKQKLDELGIKTHATGQLED